MEESLKDKEALQAEAAAAQAKASANEAMVKPPPRAPNPIFATIGCTASAAWTQGCCDDDDVL